jgi:hypothetical protein
MKDPKKNYSVHTNVWSLFYKASNSVHFKSLNVAKCTIIIKRLRIQRKYTIIKCVTVGRVAPPSWNKVIPHDWQKNYINRCVSATNEHQDRWG